MYVCIYLYICICLYICIYIHISVVTRVFLDIPVHISNVYFSKSKGLKGLHHIWKLFQKIFYNLEYLDQLKMHSPAWSNVFLQNLFYKIFTKIWHAALLKIGQVNIFRGKSWNVGVGGKDQRIWKKLHNLNYIQLYLKYKYRYKQI